MGICRNSSGPLPKLDSFAPSWGYRVWILIGWIQIVLKVSFLQLFINLMSTEPFFKSFFIGEISSMATSIPQERVEELQLCQKSIWTILSSFEVVLSWQFQTAATQQTTALPTAGAPQRTCVTIPTPSSPNRTLPCACASGSWRWCFNC